MVRAHQYESRGNLLLTRTHIHNHFRLAILYLHRRYSVVGWKVSFLLLCILFEQDGTRLTCVVIERHVVFGKVVEGLDVVDQIEGVGSQSGQTSASVVVKESGEL